MLQFISSSRVITAAEIAANTYYGVYLYKKGVVNSELVKVPGQADPFVLYSCSVWTARPGGLNPEGVKLIIAEASQDLGRNVDLVEAHQRDHYHLTYLPPGGYAIIPVGVILEVATQGLADGDNFNYIAKVGALEDLQLIDYYQRQRARSGSGSGGSSWWDMKPGEVIT